MRILLPLLAALLQVAAASAQATVDFKVHYEPNTVYQQTQTQTMRIRINLDSSSQEIRAKLDSAKPAELSPKTEVTHTQTNLITGSVNTTTGRMPIRLEVVAWDNGDATKTPPFKLVTGSVVPDSLPVFDSVVSEGQVDGFKQQFLGIINGMYSQLHLPNIKMSKGQTYTYSTPLTVPVAGGALKMKVQATYKLIDISGGVAHFTDSLMIAMDLDMKEVAIPFTGTGYGGGTLDYDVSGLYIRAMHLNYDMDIGMHQGPLIMHILLNADQQLAAMAAPAKKP